MSDAGNRSGADEYRHAGHTDHQHDGGREDAASGNTSMMPTMVFRPRSCAGELWKAFGPGVTEMREFHKIGDATMQIEIGDDDACYPAPDSVDKLDEDEEA